MSLPICLSCSAQNRESAKFCRLCGTRLPEQIISSQNNSGIIQQQTETQNHSVKIETSNSNSKNLYTDYIGLEDIRNRLQMFINTLLIRQKQKKIGMPVRENTNIIVFCVVTKL